MTKEEANELAKKVYEEWLDRREQIEKEARAAGIWETAGLDGNTHLLKKATEEAQAKIERIKAMITEE